MTMYITILGKRLTNIILCEHKW